MSSIDALWAMNAAHHKELLEVAETQRALDKVRESSRTPGARLSHTIGNILVNVGSRLKSRNTYISHKVA